MAQSAFDLKRPNPALGSDWVLFNLILIAIAPLSGCLLRTEDVLGQSMPRQKDRYCRQGVTETVVF